MMACLAYRLHVGLMLVALDDRGVRQEAIYPGYIDPSRLFPKPDRSADPPTELELMEREWEAQCERLVQQDARAEERRQRRGIVTDEDWEEFGRVIQERVYLLS